MKSSTPLTDTNQAILNNTKYQKAIKQINKLISINTSVKKQLINLQEQYDCLRNDYMTLEEKYMALQDAHTTLMQQTQLTKMGRQAHSYDESVSQGTIGQTSLQMKNTIESQRKQKQNFSPLSIPNKQLENTGTISEFVDTKRKLQQLQEKVNQKQQTIKNMVKLLAQKSKQNTQLYEKYIQSSNNRKQLKNQQQLKGAEVIQQLQQEKLHLQKQLQKSQEFVTKLTNDYEILKKKSGGKLTSSQESGITNAKSLNIGSATVLMNKPPLYGQKSPVQIPVPMQGAAGAGFSSAQQSLQNSIEKTQRLDPFSEYYFKKVRDLETQNLKIKKQFQEKKIKYKSQISRLKQDLATRDANIQQINQFIAKQQAFIQDFIIKNQGKEQVGQLKKNKMVNSPRQYQKQKGFGAPLGGGTNPGLNIQNKPPSREGPFDKYILKAEKNVNKHEAQIRTNTVQSEEYTMTQSQAQQNFGFSVQNKHKFIEGTKYYKN